MSYYRRWGKRAFDLVAGVTAALLLAPVDIWDLKLLADRGIAPDFTLVLRKADDYGLTRQDLEQGLNDALARLTVAQAGAGFVAEMSRFVSLTMAAKLERAPQLSEAWLNNAVRLAESLRTQLRTPGPIAPEH